VFKTAGLKQETLDAIASWEERNKDINDEIRTAITMSSARFGGSTLGGSIAAKSGETGKTNDSAGTSSSSRDMLTMFALENALRNNPQPLLEFAALKDFSGENVSFLSHVADWKRGWSRSPRPDCSKEHEQFIWAVRIYSHFVSLDFSEFPINVSSRTAKELHNIFNEAAQQLNRKRSFQSDSAIPFDEPPPSALSSAGSLTKGGDLGDTLGNANLKSVMQMAELSDDHYLDISIPPMFSADVFNGSESEIKYLVLTNTWPKFVKEGFESASRASQIGEDHDSSGGMKRFFCV
jgi:hypothetical protein